MYSFLEQLTDTLREKHKEQFSSLCIVFPTRRAGLFFQKHLSKKINHAEWLPAVYSINDFIQSLTSMVIADKLTLIFELYEVYKKYFPSETFEQFYPWGEMLLNDFDEADRNLVNVDLLFKNISDLKEIDSFFGMPDEEKESIKAFWKVFFNRDQGAIQKEFMNTWKYLSPVYKDFTKKLLEKRITYEGLADRKLLEELKAGNIDISFTKIVFAGFYALSKAEEEIILHLTKQGKAETYWDADNYYINDKSQEAGYFFRQNRLLTKTEYAWKADHLSSGEKQIEIIGVPLQVGQAKAAGSLLQKLVSEKSIDPESTALILPDENLLLPMLYAIPSEVKDLNVTMGFPLRSTPLFSLSESFYHLVKNIRKKKNGDISFYHRNVTELLSHPYIELVDGQSAQTLLAFIRDKRFTRITLQEITANDASGSFTTIFQNTGNAEGFLSALQNIFLLTLRHIDDEKLEYRSIEAEYIYHYYTQLNRLKDVAGTYIKNLTLDELWKLYREIMQSAKIPFAGEPLKGLQIMGFLESRVLDFENLIILSMNDGILPAVSSHPSFIPYSFRKAFGLPALEHTDAISAYHFYRLLQRAKNIYLIYNTETQGISSAEKSRYLLQIEHELSRRMPGVKIKQRIVSFPASKELVKEISITKNGDVIAALEKYIIKDGTPSAFSKKLSASGIGTYINCSLQFYFRYIAGLKEKEETEDFIEAAPFGKILHDTIKSLYDNQRVLTKEFFVEVFKRVDAALDQAIAKEYPAWETNLEGKNLLLRNVLKELIRKVLDYDKLSAPIEIKFLEADFTTPFTFNGKDAVYLYGIIDRVDRLNDTTRIVDYKTGKVEDRKPSAIEDLLNDPKFKASFQTFYYAYLYSRKAANENITAGVYPLQKFSSGMKYYKDGEPITPDEFKEFDTGLAKIISDIFNPAVPFSQTTDQDRCLYCAYKQICNR